ncbi:MAG: hypothetical protein ACRYFZ_24370 [Janthinobacterium lividum]
MNLSDIHAWLASGQDFKQGVALYTALGSSTTYQRLFSLGATAYSRPALLRELTALVPTEPAVVVAVVAVPPAAPPMPPPAPELPAASPQLLLDLRQQLKGVRDERSHLHPQLTAKNLGKKARLALALRIVALTSQEVTLKALEAHVQQHGRLPGPVATADVTDETELRRRLLTLRTRRSKLKGQPEKAEKLAAIEAEITLIQSKLTFYPRD